MPFAVSVSADIRVILAIYVVMCLLVGMGGLDRRIGFWGHFLISLVMSPIVGVVVLCTSERRAPNE